MLNVDPVEIVIEDIPESDVADPSHPLTLAIEGLQARSLKAKRNAAAMRKAAEGWAAVKTDQDWDAVCVDAAEDYASGAFLLQQLGGEAALDPPLMATLLSLRATIIEEWSIETAAECMLLDVALMTYRDYLRLQNGIGNLAFLIESELFGLEAPSARYRYRHPFADGLTAEEHLAKIREGMMPLADRASRMFMRTLKSIRELRQRPVPTIAVASAAQVNVGGVQANRMTER